jgi:uncharacterized protein YndB with AHSA1/START domain
MEQNKFDWSCFKRRVYIKNTTKQILFQKWTTSKGLEQWFVKSSQFTDSKKNLLEPEEVTTTGNTYNWKFHNGNTITGKVLEIVSNSSFKFTFGKSDPTTELEVTVKVNFFDGENESGFDIIQENMSDSKHSKVNSYISCNMGWEFHMMNLKSIIETNYDLRIKDGSRRHVDTPNAYPLETYSWTEFTVREYFNSHVDTIFKYWTTSSKIVLWFLKKAHFLNPNGLEKKPDEMVNPNDSYSWQFGKELTMIGKILDIELNKYIIFTFGQKEPGSNEYVQVKVSFEENNNKTKVIIKQNNIVDNDFGQINYNLSCILGWTYYMTNLRSILESGYDLRDKDPDKDLEMRLKTLA